MHLKIIFTIIVSSLLITACDSNTEKKLSCTPTTHSGSLIPNCDTDSAKLESSVESLNIIKGKRTKTVDLTCNDGSIAGGSITDYNVGKTTINVSGSTSASCEMNFNPSPLNTNKKITTQEEIDALLEWGEDPQDASYDSSTSTCPEEVLDNIFSPNDISDGMIQACKGSFKVDFEFTDENDINHSFTLNYTIK